MRSEARARLSAVLVLLASCASADDLMYAYTGKQAGSGQDPGVADEGIGVEVDACVPDWSCTGWTACGCGNTQARTCMDKNGCGTTAGKPAESQACDHCGNGSCDCGETAATCPQDGCSAVTCPAGYVLVPAGEFEMGSPAWEPGHRSDEVLHHVKLNRAFCLKATEVTQDEWNATFAGWNPSAFPSCGACPVEQVSWYDAVAYANEMSKSAGLTPCYALSEVRCEDGTQVGTAYKDCMNGTRGGIDSAKVGLNGVSKPYECEGFRLPTEAEWEYAARAGTTKGTWKGDLVDPFGKPCDQPVLNPIAWYCGNAPKKTHAVGEAGHDNPWGLYDMLGNVWEWCWDSYAAYQGDETDPTGGAGSGRVFRGGGWGSNASYVRAAVRFFSVPGYRIFYLGFRPARSSP